MHIYSTFGKYSRLKTTFGRKIESYPRWAQECLLNDSKLVRDLALYNNRLTNGILVAVLSGIWT